MNRASDRLAGANRDAQVNAQPCGPYGRLSDARELRASPVRVPR